MIRHLSHSLNRSLPRCCTRFATRMLGGARRRDEFGAICALLNKALRIHKRTARRDPHLFGPHAGRYFLDTVQLEKDQQEIAAALHKVYGPAPDGQPEPGSTVWTSRYAFRSEAQRRIHLRWFKENYGGK